MLRNILELHERRIADVMVHRADIVAVFDRDPNYDTSQDPVVRGTAGEVRKRISSLYVEPPALVSTARTYSPPRMSCPHSGQWMPFEVGTSVSQLGHSIHCSVAS